MTTDEKSPRADLSAFDVATIERARLAVREYMDWISDTGGDETGKLSPFAQDALVHQFAWYLSRRSPPSGYRLVPVEPTREMIGAGVNEAHRQGGSYAASEIYRAMIAAAPQSTEGK